MLFNCLQCGTCISSKRDLCPYCNADLGEVRRHVEGHAHQYDSPGVEHITLKEKFKGTFLSLVIR